MNGAPRITPARRVLLATVLATVAAAACWAASATAAGQPTVVHVYSPFTSSGRIRLHVHVVHGSCFSGALSVNRSDAWRCMSANEIADPCFASPRASGFVVCPAAAWESSGIEIVLTKPLPHKLADHGSPSTRAVPWAMQTASGQRCQIDTGATSAIHGVRLNYFCTPDRQLGLWGVPGRSSSVWTIFAAPITATKLSARIGIAVAWT